MITKIIKIKKTVEKILKECPDTRDSDKLLLLKVWAEQAPELRNRYFLFRNFAFEFKKGNFADPESIRRSRQKLQEQQPKLRGRNYQGRMEEEAAIRFGINKL